MSNVLPPIDVTFQSARASNDDGSAFNVGGLQGITIQVTGTFTATIYPETSLNDQDWDANFAVNLATAAIATTITAPGRYFIPIPNCSKIRCRVGGYVTGTITVIGKASDGPSAIVLSLRPQGATPGPANITQIGNATFALGQQAMGASLPVVMASNQSAIPITGALDVTATISIAGEDSGSNTLALQGLNSVGVVLTGTWVAELKPQVSADGGTTWEDAIFYDVSSKTFSTTVEANGTYNIAFSGGMSHARIFCPTGSYTSGTVTGTLRASSQSSDLITAQIAPLDQLAASASIPVVQAYDSYKVPSVLNANSITTALQPAGGPGPIQPVPTEDGLMRLMMQELIDAVRLLTMVLAE